MLELTRILYFLVSVMSTALKNPLPTENSHLDKDSLLVEDLPSVENLTSVDKQYTPHRFTVKEYYQMAETGGVFDINSKTELIEGEVVDMVPIGCKHADWVNHLSRFFSKLVPDDVVIGNQNPIHLSDISEPQPDLALLAPREKPYSEAHPNPDDVLLLIEVADSSLLYDCDYKAALYAQHGISEYWVIDIEGNELIVFRDPSENGYRSTYRPELDEIIALQFLDDIRVDLSKLFIG